MSLSTKALSILALLASAATAQNERTSFVNGENCSLQAKISCTADLGNGETVECKQVPVFDRGLCGTGQAHIWTATYVIEYSNTNSINRDIVFSKGINPESSKGNPFTFARANTFNIGIDKQTNMPRNTERSFTATRVIDLCAENPKRKLFISEVQMNGFMEGKNGNNKFSCSARDFYRKQIIFIEGAAIPAPTVAPTAAPTVAPTVAPIPAPTPNPTMAPTVEPTAAPTAANPVPTSAPTSAPTSKPTSAPTGAAVVVDGKGGKGKKKDKKKGQNLRRM